MDQVAALSTLIMGGATASHVDQEYINGLLQGVANNAPEFFKFLGTEVEPAQLRINGLIRDVDKVSVDREVFRRWLEPWGAKQALAFWYKHTNKILPSQGGLFVHWIPNAHVEERNKFYELFKDPSLRYNEVKQGKKRYNDQLFYLFKFTTEMDNGMFLFSYHKSALIWAGVFEDIDQAMKYLTIPIYRTSMENGVELYSYPIETKKS